MYIVVENEESRLEEGPNVIIPRSLAPKGLKYGPSLGSIVSGPYLFKLGLCQTFTKQATNFETYTTLLSARRIEKLYYERSQLAKNVTTNTLALPHLPLELWHLILESLIYLQFSRTQTP